MASALRQLGAIGFDLFWIVVASGVVLYAFFDTSVSGAYTSIERLGALGVFLRSLHRYSSDAFVVVMVAHALREALAGRFRGFRWFSWVSGVPIVWLAFGAGIGGFLLPWDQLAEWVGIGTAEWFAALPGFGHDIVRNFVSIDGVTDRLFSLLVFLHIGLPLALLLALWVHIQRITGPRIRPDGPTRWTVAGSLVLLSLAWPVQSHPPAAAERVPAVIGVDWFYLFPYPALERIGAAPLWLVVAIATLAITLMPWIGRRARVRAAVVDPRNCNGCAGCVADCPFAAITMIPHESGRAGRRQALVRADFCAACGICAGACPSSTPFRSIAALASGIDVPVRTVDDIRAEVAARLTPGAPLVFACAHANDPPAGAVALVCAGQLPPSFVDFALRRGASEVTIVGCGECEFRLGMDHLRARLAGTREPRLRSSVPRARIKVVPND